MLDSKLLEPHESMMNSGLDFSLPDKVGDDDIVPKLYTNTKKPTKETRNIIKDPKNIFMLSNDAESQGRENNNVSHFGGHTLANAFENSAMVQDGSRHSSQDGINQSQGFGPMFASRMLDVTQEQNETRVMERQGTQNMLSDMSRLNETQMN